MKITAALICVLLTTAAVAHGQTPAVSAPRPPADPNKLAVILSGAGGEEAYAKQFAEWTNRLKSALVERLGFGDDRVFVLSENITGAARPTADEVRRVFKSLQTSATQESSVFIFFIGHGSFDGREAKFNLTGPDIALAEYRTLVNALPARRTVIFQMASASGEFVKGLAGRGRVVVTATRSGQEQNATRFAEHFIAALDSRDADADQNGRVSVLEAFNYATRLVAEHYKRAGRLATEHALIEDSGDGVGSENSSGTDGSLARNVYFDSMNAEQAAASAEVARLLRERTRLEDEVEQLKARKRLMKEMEYEAELERLFITLAKTNRSIKRGGQ